MTDPRPPLHLLVPGEKLPGDWFAGRIPANIEVGPNTRLESSHTFHHFYAQGPCGFRAGRGVTLWRTSLAVERDGLIEVGDDCYLANASLACVARITLGRRVAVAGGVTILDSDFHPMGPAARFADTLAISPLGDRTARPQPAAQPVVIDDDVWIGCNATILKGVHIGAGAVIAPGAVVSRNVPAGATVAGNPAQLQNQTQEQS